MLRGGRPFFYEPPGLDWQVIYLPLLLAGGLNSASLHKGTDFGVICPWTPTVNSDNYIVKYSILISGESPKAKA